MFDFARFFYIQSCETEYENEVELKDIVYTMGANKNGVIGNGTTDDVSQPYTIIGLRNIAQVVASSQTSMALASNGKVFAWGNNIYGQIGIGDTTKICSFPREIKGLPEIQKIATSLYISMALDKDGNVWIWGTIFIDDFKEVAPIFSSSVPQKMNLSNIIDITCGSYHCVAVSSTGEVYTWGRNAVGMLGDGTNVHRVEPKIISGINNVKRVLAGYYHTIALSNNNTLYSWGYNLHGELGKGSSGISGLTPSIIPSLQNVVDMAIGGSHNLCLLSDETLWAWGENYSGQLGNGGTSSNVYYPIQITYLTGIKLIAASGSSSVALTNDNKFWAWGNYYFTSFSGGYSGYSKNIPTRIEQLDNSKIITTGGYHYIIVK